MNNRKRIEKALVSSGYKVKSIEFYREKEYAYGDCSDASYWFVQTECGESFQSDLGDSVDEGVDLMIKEIEYSAREENKDTKNEQ